MVNIYEIWKIAFLNFKLLLICRKNVSFSEKSKIVSKRISVKKLLTNNLKFNLRNRKQQIKRWRIYDKSKDLLITNLMI